MFRWLAILFALGGALLLGLDLVAWLTAGDDPLRFAALGEVWFAIHPDSLQLAQPAIERHLAPEIWAWIVQPMLEAPAFVCVFGLAAIFGLLAVAFRPRKRKTMLG